MRSKLRARAPLGEELRFVVGRTSLGCVQEALFRATILWSRGQVSRAAQALGVGRRTIYEFAHRHQIDLEALRRAQPHAQLDPGLCLRLGIKVRSLREAAGLTRAALGAAVGLAPWTIRSIEWARPVCRAAVEQIAQHLGIDLGALAQERAPGGEVAAHG